MPGGQRGSTVIPHWPSASLLLFRSWRKGTGGAMTGIVTAVSRSATHTMSKPNQPAIRLVEGLGVEQDAHQGKTVKHRSRVERDPNQPNLRQVHLIHAEL